MGNKLILIVAFVVFFILLSTTSFVIINMFNKLFFKYNTRTIINFVMIFNVSYLVFYFISIIIGNNFFRGLHRILNYYFGFLIIGLSIAVIFWIVYFGLNIFQKEQILVSKEIGIVISLIFLFVNSLAIYNFEKAYKFNPNEYFLKEYLYFAYLYAGRQTEAGIFASSFTQSQKEKLKIDDGKFIDELKFTYNTSFNDDQSTTENYSISVDENKDGFNKFLKN